MFTDPVQRTSTRSVRPALHIAESVICISEQTLCDNRRWSSHERIVYWAGTDLGEVWFITSVIRPEAQTARGSFHTSLKANAEVALYLADSGLKLLGQVHTHPGLFVDHSDGDDEMAVVVFENFLSIVVPVYGKQGILPLSKCGVHRYEGGQFRRLPASDVERKFRIIPAFKDFQGSI